MRAVLNPCKTIAPQLCNTTSELAKNPYCAISAPPSHTRLIISAERIAKTILIRETSHQLTPTRDATADSTNILRSEEHTSELQSRFDLVCRLLLENTKTANTVSINL